MDKLVETRELRPEPEFEAFLAKHLRDRHVARHGFATLFSVLESLETNVLNHSTKFISQKVPIVPRPPKLASNVHDRNYLDDKSL